LKFPRQTLAELIKKGKLDDILKMQERETENYTTLDEHGKLKVFDSVADMVSYFVTIRVLFYEKRKARLLIDLEQDVKFLSNRARFVKAIIDKEIAVSGVKKVDLVKTLDTMKFDKEEGTYDYLLSMPIQTLTQEKYDELCKKVDAKNKELDKIKKTSPDKMYRDDLSALRVQVLKEFKQ
jgi:DNA topoisomerase-2